MKIKTCGIYKITSITKCVYIGQSINIEQRWDYHKSYQGDGSPRLHNSFKKHGVENHTFEILEECPRELLNEREVYWIKHFDTFDTPHGMNLRSGGEGGLVTEETRKKQKGNRNASGPRTEEQRKNMSKPRSEEGRKNISDSKIGVPKSEEFKNNLKGNTNASGPRTEEQRKNMRVPRSEVSRKNMSNAALKRSPTTEETKKKMSDLRKGVPKSPESIAKREATKKRNREEKQQFETEEK